MARRTEAQKRQQELAWALFQVGGAAGNLGQLSRKTSTLPLGIQEDFKVITRWLREIETKLRQQSMLAAQETAARNSTRPPSTRRKL